MQSLNFKHIYTFFFLFLKHMFFFSRLKEPCTDCVAPYGFLNHMPLSTTTSDFVKLVRSAQVSGNLDAPEGGFDAIMQAIVCKVTMLKCNLYYLQSFAGRLFKYTYILLVCFP